jgi:hypothetical protein
LDARFAGMAGGHLLGQAIKRPGREVRGGGLLHYQLFMFAQSPV